MVHKHKWKEKVDNHAFRYCHVCGQLERNMGIGFQIYPRIRLNIHTGEMLESSGYHKVITVMFDKNHVTPEYPDFGDECWMCRQVPDNLATRQEDWPEIYVNLCQSCYSFNNEEWKSGSCIGGEHKWHPVCSNPKRCYRCDFTSDLDNPTRVEQIITEIIHDYRTIEDPEGMLKNLADTLRKLLKWEKVTPADIKRYMQEMRQYFTVKLGYTDTEFSRLIKRSFDLQERTIEVEI